jgi:hypothetical protein
VVQQFQEKYRLLCYYASVTKLLYFSNITTQHYRILYYVMFMFCFKSTDNSHVSNTEGQELIWYRYGLASHGVIITRSTKIGELIQETTLLGVLGKSSSSSSLQVLGLRGLLQSKQRIFMPSLHWAS